MLSPGPLTTRYHRKKQRNGFKNTQIVKILALKGGFRLLSAVHTKRMKGGFRPLFAVRTKRIKTNDIENPLEVIAGQKQMQLALHLVKPADEKMGPATPEFQRAKRMFTQPGAFAHVLAPLLLHALTMPLDHLFMFPAIELPIGRFLW